MLWHSMCEVLPTDDFARHCAFFIDNRNGNKIARFIFLSKYYVFDTLVANKWNGPLCQIYPFPFTIVTMYNSDADAFMSRHEYDDCQLPALLVEVCTCTEKQNIRMEKSPHCNLARMNVINKTYYNSFISRSTVDLQKNHILTESEESTMMQSLAEPDMYKPCVF